MNASQALEARTRYRLSIGDETFVFAEHSIADSDLTGSQIAGLANVRPLREYVVLRHLLNGELEALRPNETATLQPDDEARFFVIRGSVLYRLDVDGLALEWPKESLKGRDIRFLVRASSDQKLVLKTESGDQEIEEDDWVTLRAEGVEILALLPRTKTVTVYYRHEPVELEKRIWTTEELIEKFEVPAGYKLDLIKDGCEFVELKPGERLPLQEGMEFTSHAPRGQSS